MTEANETQVRREICDLILEQVDAQGWDVARTALELKIPQAKVTAIRTDRTEGNLSLSKLLALLDELGVEVHIVG